jgi:hypothetical protein
VCDVETVVRRFVLAVLNTIGFNHFNASIIAFYRKAHLINTITGLDLFKDAQIPFGEFGGFVKTFLNTLKKAVLLVR